MPARVLVVGSINIDTRLEVPRLPTAGETVDVRQVATSTGGKGANQAAAAAIFGAATRLVGAVGSDADDVLAGLDTVGVDTSGVHEVEGVRTGRAWVWVEDSGENLIGVLAGANHRIDPGRVRDQIGSAGGAVVVTQGEVGASTIELAAQAAADAGERFVLNLAPFIPVAEAAVGSADPLVVNLGEAEALVDQARDTDDEIGWGTWLADRLAARARSVVVTLGGAGAVVSDGTRVVHVPAEQVDDVVDTVGAGDAFVGVLAAALAGGADLVRSAQLAGAAAARSVRHHGTVESYMK